MRARNYHKFMIFYRAAPIATRCAFRAYILFAMRIASPIEAQNFTAFVTQRSIQQLACTKSSSTRVREEIMSFQDILVRR